MLKTDHFEFRSLGFRELGGVVGLAWGIGASGRRAYPKPQTLGV